MVDNMPLNASYERDDEVSEQAVSKSMTSSNNSSNYFNSSINNDSLSTNQDTDVDVDDEDDSSDDIFVKVPIFAKKHIFNDIKGLPDGIKYGWIRYCDIKHSKSENGSKNIFSSKNSKPMISLGLFEDNNRKFRQLAIADYEGRVYLGNDMTVEDIYYRFTSLYLLKQQEIILEDKSRFYGNKLPNKFSAFCKNINEAFKETYDPKSDDNLAFENYKDSESMDKEIEEICSQSPELIHEVEKISKLYDAPDRYDFPFYDDTDGDCVDIDCVDEDNDLIITGSNKIVACDCANSDDEDDSIYNNFDANQFFQSHELNEEEKARKEGQEKNKLEIKKSHTFWGRIKFFMHTFSRLCKSSTFRVLRGDVVIHTGPFEGPRWVASWLCAENNGRKSYTIEQARTPLAGSLRYNLEYKDAIAIVFFATYLIPNISEILTSFGVENIFHRLHTQAPLCAIRNSVKDIQNIRVAGLRYSGLEAYFERLMHESGALNPIRSLEQKHGAEVLHLNESSVSRNYEISWDNALDPESALVVLSIEGALNRIHAISDCIEESSSSGSNFTENEVTYKQAAQIDFALIEDPAFGAYLKFINDFGSPLQDDKIKPLETIWKQIRYERKSSMIKDYRTNNEWAYRQRLSHWIRTMRTPFRFDADFRSNIEDGNVAIGFMAVGPSVMPRRSYDAFKKHWVNLSASKIATMTTEYNLRLGIILALIAFAANPAVKNVSVRLDSICLEEMVAANNNAIDKLLNRTLSALNDLVNQQTHIKGEPKDGDVHGNPEQIHEAKAYDSSCDSSSISSRTESANNISSSSSSSDSSDSSDSTISSSSEFDDKNNSDESSRSLLNEKSRKTLMTVTFTRKKFVEYLRSNGLKNPIKTYKEFFANMNIDSSGALKSVDPTFDLRDTKFAPRGAQEEPEFSDRQFNDYLESILGTCCAKGLAIQREDLLQQAVSDFHHIASELMPTTAEKAHMAMDIINSIDDPELSEKSGIITKSLIDEDPIPELDFHISKDIRNMRLKAHTQLEMGEISQGIEEYEKNVAYYDAMFSEGKSIPRYFNSYAERVIYNRMFANNNESMRLIPDGLFYSHMELADIYSQLHDSNKTLQHLRSMVVYAPTYALSHLRLATELSRHEDWDSVFAACLNALRVALDQDDAAFAYYRLAYAEWMRDHFDSALASYQMAESIAPEHIETLNIEKEELLTRMKSQGMQIFDEMDDIIRILKARNIPYWPDTNARSIIDSAAKETVNNGMFVIARTLCVASARMNYSKENNDVSNAIQMQFLRSLNA